MLKFIEELLSAFHACPMRTAVFEWFVVIVVGSMVHSNHLGVTSIVGVWRSIRVITNRCFISFVPPHDRLMRYGLPDRKSFTAQPCFFLFADELCSSETA